MNKKLIKRLLSLAVVVVLVMTMLPTVFAEDPVYTDWDGSSSAIVDGAYLKLTADKDITARYFIGDAKTVTIDLNGNKITSSAATQIFYITGGAKLTLKNGTIEAPGLAAETSSMYGALIQINGTDGNELTLDGVTITKTAGTSALKSGGILYAGAPVTIKNSTLQVADTTGHDASTLEGGLIKFTTGCTLTLENSTLKGTTAKYGGCIFVNGGGKLVVKEGTTITGGTATSMGHDIYFGNARGRMEVYGGVVGKVHVRSAQMDLFGGTLTNKWESSSTGVVNVSSGVTFYFNPVVNGIEGFEAYLMDKSTSQTKYTVYADFDDAIAAAQSGNTVSLMSDVTAGEVAVPAGVTLNLYGKTLTADSVSSAFESAQIKDEKSSKNAGGKLICNNVSVHEDNVFAPIYHEGAYHFQKFAVNDAQDGNVYKFYFADAADSILLDDAWTNGSEGSGLKLLIDVTWTNGAGEPKSKTFEFSSDLVADYAAGWDSKMFTLTFSDLTNVTDLACTARVAVAA